MMRWHTRDRLTKVAAIYTHAVAAGQPPTKAVAEQLHVSHSHAANLVARARKIGKLEPTTRGVAHAEVDRPR